MRNIVLIVLTFCSQILFAQPISKVWVSDNGDGTYKNPVLHSDYSDPDVCRAGDDYYMVSSSFTCMPAIPILHSKDLVNWKLVNYALQTQIPEEVFDKTQQMKGVWAPSIRFHNGEFYIYYPDPDYGIYVLKTKNPLGDWGKPTLILEGKGIIDPCPLWDDNGKAYLSVAYARSRAGVNSVIALHKMSPDGMKILDKGKIIFDERQRHHTMEGGKLYKRNGYYYIFAPAGGVQTGWQVVMRSKDIYGAYEDKIVLAQGKTPINGPHQGAWVDTKTGEDWFLHFQDKDAYGRVVHLQPMKWVNDFPVMGNNGEPVLTYKKPNVKKNYPICTPPESDEFSSDTLGLQWQWNANPKTVWYSLIRGKDFLRLYSMKLAEPINYWNVPNVLLQKFPAPDFTATTKVHLSPDGEGTQTGLIVLGRNYSRLAFEKTKLGYTLSQIDCIDADLTGKEVSIDTKLVSDSTITLRVKVSSPNGMCQFSYSTNEKDFINIGKPFKARAGGWIGAKFGLYCNSLPNIKSFGYADFDWFRIDK